MTEVKDEDGRRTLTFKNTFGQVLLIRNFAGAGRATPLDTYYVYDAHGMLCWVLPPMASDALTADKEYDRNTEAIGRYAYYYRYDGRQDMITKQLPGCNPVEYWRDKAGRIALMQDGNLRKKGKFQYYYYDAFGNVTQTGMCKLNLIETEERFRAYTYTVYAKSSFDPAYPHGYRPHMPGGLPVTHKEPVMISYYDNYEILSLPGFKGKSEFTSS